MSTSRAGPSEKLWSLIRDLRYPVLTTRGPDGGLQSRPVTMQNRDSDPLDFLWFFAPRRCRQIEDLQWDSSVSIVFADPDRGACVAVFGSAAVVEDPARKKMLWSAEAASWFEGGPEDPGLALVRARIIQADCWDVESNQVTPLFILDTGTMPFRSPFDQGNRGTLRH